MYFILNGINSYITTFDGLDEWQKGLEQVRQGNEYISPAVVERIDMRRDYPDPAGKITDHLKQVILLVCNGFKDEEIADLLGISRRTVTTHKTVIFTTLNVRNPNELIRAALYLEIVQQEGLIFYPYNFVLNPLPYAKICQRGK
jgi:two-component system invasion response regulator UvrY